ncbi:Type 2A phosphatase-associated protein 42 [Coemansia sp. RSA 552]|nr:Type 2A phosphatase-associated protein 42 [Coemansia sp. RSA 552]
MQDSTNEVPLGLGFVRAQQQLEALNNNTAALASGSSEYQRMAKGIVQQLQQCLDQIHKHSLFSSNETVEDYTTSELRYVLTRAYLGEALQKLVAPETRVAVLEKALDHYQQFLSMCQDLGIIDRLATTAEAVQGQKKADAGQTRIQRIERYRRLKAMQQEVSELETRLGADGGEERDMEEAERELAVKLIALKVHQVTDDMDLLNSELDMARQMEQMRQARQAAGPETDKRQRASTSQKGSEWRLDTHSYKDNGQNGGQRRPIFNERGQPMQPFVLTNNRQQIKKDVFRPGWALPTMSVDEYLRLEEERGNILSGGGKEPEPKQAPDDNDHEAQDAETMKQREWDAFTDDNPRGWGNRGGNRG